MGRKMHKGMWIGKTVLAHSIFRLSAMATFADFADFFRYAFRSGYSRRNGFAEYGSPSGYLRNVLYQINPISNQVNSKV